MPDNQSKRLSRRAFARHAVLYSASAALITDITLLNSNAQTGPASQFSVELPKLTAESQAEAEARFQLVLSRYGTRLNDEDRRNIKTLCYFSQSGLDRLRAFSLKNGDVPALFLKPIVEREKLAQLSRPASDSLATPKHS